MRVRPLPSSRSAKPRTVGYMITLYWCRKCAPGGIRDGAGELIREGQDYGVPYHCDDCGEPMLPCDHQWDEWRPAYNGGEIRFCTVPDCGEAEYR